MNNHEKLPKTPGIGSLHLEYKRCGKPTCRCCRGLLHGPYAYLHRRDRGSQKKTYVPMASLSKAFEDIGRQKEQSPTTAEILRLLKEPSYA
jgi:hypothetical protein